MTLVEINPHSMMSYECQGRGHLHSSVPASADVRSVPCLGLYPAVIQIREQT